MKENVLSSKPEKPEETLRPSKMSSYIGQEKMKKNLSICMESAKIRNAPLDHMLFYGPPGLGKTTIAGVIAEEMGKKILSVTGPVIERAGDLASKLSSLGEGDMLFIDEIHRIPSHIEEILYPAMEDFVIDIVIGESSTSRTIRLELPKFTLIGATTRPGMLSSPLRDRFGSVNKLEFYTPAELAAIIKRDAAVLDIKISDDASMEIGRRSRGTPRIAIRILKRLIDFAVVKNSNDPVIDMETARYGLSFLDVDENGLDKNDLKILKSIHENFKDGPVGLETLAAFIAEDEKTVEDVYEPYLMQTGLLQKTPRGRILTEKGIQYMQ